MDHLFEPMSTQEKLEDYRREHVEFHNDRVSLFMSAARIAKDYMAEVSGPNPYVASLVSQLVHHARLENSICVWWKRLDDDDLSRQIEFWE